MIPYDLLRRGCLDVIPRTTASTMGVIRVAGDQQVLVGEPERGTVLTVGSHAWSRGTSFCSADQGGVAEGLIAVSPQFQGQASGAFVAVSRCGHSHSSDGVAVSGERSTTHHGIAITTSQFPHTLTPRAEGNSRAIVVIDICGMGCVGLGGVLIVQIPEDMGPHIVAVAGKDIKPNVWYKVADARAGTPPTLVECISLL